MRNILDKLFPSNIKAIEPMIRRERQMYHELKRRYNRVEALNKLLAEQNTELLEALKEIRDLARTGIAPNNFGLDVNEWAQHRLLRIAGDANQTIAKAEGETSQTLNSH